MQDHYGRQEPVADRQQPQGAMDPTPPLAACLSGTAALLSFLACEGTGSLGPPLIRVVDDQSRWLGRHPSPSMEVCGAAPAPSVGHGRCFCGHLRLLAGCLAIRHMPSPVDCRKPPSPSAGRSLMHVQMYLLLHSAQPGSRVQSRPLAKHCDGVLMVRVPPRAHEGCVEPPPCAHWHWHDPTQVPLEAFLHPSHLLPVCLPPPSDRRSLGGALSKAPRSSPPEPNSRGSRHDMHGGI